VPTANDSARPYSKNGAALALQAKVLCPRFDLG
jgi:hypothetical protein